MAKFEFDPVKQRGSTERTRRLRAESMSTQPHIYIERAVLETEAYKMYEGTCSVPELRAKSLLHFFQNKNSTSVKTNLSLVKKATVHSPHLHSQNCAAILFRICTT